LNFDPFSGLLSVVITQVHRYTGTQVCRYAGMQVCRYTGIQVSLWLDQQRANFVVKIFSTPSSLLAMEMFSLV